MMQVCEDLEEGFESEIQTIWISDMVGQRDLFFMTNWKSNILGHMEFTLCLIFLNVFGRKAVAREMVLFSLVVLLKQWRLTNQHLVLTLILCSG